jgi:hypothetical protein
LRRTVALCKATIPRVAVAVLTAAFLVGLRPAAGWAGVATAVTIGYDSFIDRFTVLEEDTAETVQELYGGIKNNLEHRSGSMKLGLSNFFRFGNQTVDENFDGELSLSPWEHTRIDLRSNVHWKHFQEGSDYSFGNDYIQSNNYMRLRRHVRDGFLISWKSRLELVDYEKRTDFDYDYRYIDTGLELEIGSFLDRFLRAGAALGFKEAPDTTALGYCRTTADLELLLASAGGTMLRLAVLGDRRDYRETVRSSYWNVLSNAELTVTGLSGRSVSLRFESELTLFDSPTAVYFDTHFIRGGVRLKCPITATASIFAEPRFAGMFCGDFPEERYWEGTAILGIDIIGSDTFWGSLSYEPGYRDYITGDNDLYSSFYVNRLTLMGSVSLPSRLELNAFISHDPERHARRDDDFSITLISIDLTRRF